MALNLDYDIGEAFKAIEEELIASMMRNMKRHFQEETQLDMDWTAWQAEQLYALDQYKRRTEKKYGKEFHILNDRIEELIRQANASGRMDQELEILKAIKKGVNLHRQKGSALRFFKVNDRKLNALIKATRADMEKAETAILRMSQDRYRQIIFNSQVYASTGAGTYEKAVDMATHDFMLAGLNCVQYKNGARHTLADYADMAIRTAAKRAYLQGEGEMRQEWGIHTVIINKRSDNPCPKCLPFVGKVMIDDVWSGGSRKDGDYPLMSEAVAAGLYHPRCRDSHTTYFPGISTPPGAAYTKREIARIKIRAKEEAEEQRAEQEAEKYKRLADNSLDPENQRIARVREEEKERKTALLSKRGEKYKKDTRKYLGQKKHYDPMDVLNPIKHTRKELKELEEYAGARGFRIHRIENFYGSSELLKEQIDILRELCDEYRIDQEIVIGFASMGHGEYGFTSKKGNIFFNSRALIDRESTKISLNTIRPGEHTIAAKDIKGISPHEFGHVLSQKYGHVGLDIAQEAYYNVYGKWLSDDAMLKELKSILSEYSLTEGELLSEVLGRHYTEQNDYTTEFIRILKGRWGL